MSLILLGILNSQVSPAAAGAYDHLETQTLSSAAATVTFSNLGDYASAGYKDLQLRMTARSTRADTDSLCYIQFNSDTGSNYACHYLRGTGSVADAGYLSSSYASGVVIYTGLPASTNTSGAHGVNVIDIQDPFNAFKNTTTRILNGYAGSTSRVGIQSGVWFNTNSVTSITLDDIFANFDTYSRFSLYGVK